MTIETYYMMCDVNHGSPHGGMLQIEVLWAGALVLIDNGREVPRVMNQAGPVLTGFAVGAKL